MSAVKQLQTFTVIMLVVFIFRGYIVISGMLKKTEKRNGTGKLTFLFSSSTDTSSGRVAQAGNNTEKM